MLPWVRKVLKGKRFADVEEAKDRNTKYRQKLEAIKINDFHDHPEQWGSVPTWALRPPERTSPVTEA